MKQLRDIEALRLTEQERIDALKSSPERNRLGQFATPAALAADIARFVQGLWGNRGPVRFLEPAIGTGAFYSAALAVFSRKRIAAAMGFEVDRQFVDAAKELWQGGSLNVVHADFTTQPPPSPADRYNLVLTNPPYVRHHHLNRDQKEALLSAALARTHLNVSGLAGLYSYFVLLAHSWMTEDALAAWLIPSEFMEVNYGSALRRYLTE
jgi:predicted RNA methylase